MRFCKDCGAVLQIFGNDTKDLCSTCIQQQKRFNPPPPPVQADRSDLLDDTTLVCENGKLILRSKEGWELWSCPVGTPVSMKTLMTRAQRIYEIRLKRQKN